MGATLTVWQDPWHPLGVLIHRFPRGPQVIGISLETKLSVVIHNGTWNWPEILDIQHRDITDTLPPLERADRICWNGSNDFTTMEAYHLFQPTGPKVNWSSLLLGPYRIARNCFILWLAILERLSTLDCAWWQGQDRSSVLYARGIAETHDHLFFGCEYFRRCLQKLRSEVHFSLSFQSWRPNVDWVARHWRGRHPLNAASRALLASLVFHIWMERNQR
ncbi:UNVERIFIED_CONTAM: hypothetical protein Slati_3117000 [Sesamum latifolium]|uniref:Reverse transcriptase zinc-binding domain-containing protein n=1 Tax=Sesamum latifolium TaxID=2727402 RepID=A0AAW2V0P1_9LAMI